MPPRKKSGGFKMLDFAVPFLICFPFLISLFLLFSGKSKIGNAIARIGAVVIFFASVAFFVARGIKIGFSVTEELYVNTEIADYVILGG